MNFADLYGLLTVVFVAAASIAALFPKKRLFVLVPAAVLMLIPFGRFGQAAEYLFALTDIVSIPLLAGSLFLLLGKPSPFRKRELIGVTLIGLALYLTEEGLIPYDIYGWGYQFDFTTAAVCLGIWLLTPLEGALLLIGYLLFRFGIYQNFFDAVLDPIFVFTALIELIRRYWVQHRKKNRLKNGEIG